jgi:hypothetical protein
LDTDETLERRLASILTPHLLSQDPTPVILQLQEAAGTDARTLARFCGVTAGFFMNAQTSTMCTALLTEIEGAEEWADLGRERRKRATAHPDGA